MKNKISKKLLIISLLPLVAGVFSFSSSQIGKAEVKKDTFKLAHIKSFEPFAVVKEGKSEGLAIDILTEALVKVNLKVVFIGEHQDKVQDLL